MLGLENGKNGKFAQTYLKSCQAQLSCIFNHACKLYGLRINPIGHMNKASGSKSTYRGLGSIDFQATARSVLIVGRIKDDPTCRVIAHDKSSLAPEGDSIAFRLDKENGFAWEGVIDISVDDLLSGDQKVTKLTSAKEFLAKYLADGPKPSTEIFEAAEADGIKKRTLFTAKEELNVTATKTGDKWYWGF
jgi:hypothetical protein